MREKSIISILEKQIDKIIGVTMEISNMPLGDAGIYNPEGEEYVLFERKTLNDLAASIKDGRYSEQSLRLKAIDTANHNIIYIVEGSFDQYKHNSIHPQTLVSAIVSLNYFKGFSVMRTTNSLETAQLMLRYLEKIHKTKDKVPYYNHLINKNTVDMDKATINKEVPYVSVVKRTKKENITIKNIVSIMLCQIPNVSTASAEAISQQFTTIEQLVMACKSGKHLFDNIRMGKTKRRLSSQCIHNIIQFILGSEELDEIEVNTTCSKD